MNCERRRTVVAIDKSGVREDKWKCAHAQANTYGQRVDADACAGCVLRVPILYKLKPCGSKPPAEATYKQPTFAANGALVYEPIDGPEPPIPDGYERVAHWVYASKWKECPARAYLNSLNPDGSLQLETHCTILNKPITCAECAACIMDIEHVGSAEEMGGIPEFPSVGKQLSNYWEAVKKWVKAGRPVRSDEEVARLHHEHCSTCDWFDKESSRCKGCGCNVKPSGTALLNKIKMATEHCPKKLW